jgi:hypothetical protein
MLEEERCSRCDQSRFLFYEHTYIVEPGAINVTHPGDGRMGDVESSTTRYLTCTVCLKRWKIKSEKYRWESKLKVRTASTRWTFLYVAMKFLTLHKAAAISANHPTRKRDRGEFNVE